MPTAAGVKGGAEWALPPLSGLFGEVKTGAQHRWCPPARSNSWKVTVPVGLKPPLTDAVSLTDVPIGPPADAVVAMARSRLGNGHRLGRGAPELTVVLLASPL